MTYESVLSLAAPALDAPTPEGASALFAQALTAAGASYFQSRLYRRPTGTLTSERHWAAGGFVARYARTGWVGSEGFNHICFRQNPLLQPIREGRTRYRFSDFAPRSDPTFRPYWEALTEAAIAEALCATAYGAGRATASLHMGFDTAGIAPREAAAIQIAGMALAERLLAFDPPEDEADDVPRLTARERDCLGFVADGKTDWEIARILSVGEATARFHVDNARKKLNAATRAHAVARFLALHGLF